MTLSPTAQKEWDDLQDEDSLSIPLTYDQKQAQKRLRCSIASKAAWAKRDRKPKYSALTELEQRIIAVYSVEQCLATTADICRVQAHTVRNMVNNNLIHIPNLALYLPNMTEARLWQKYLQQLDPKANYPSETCLLYFNEILKRTDEGCDPKLLIKLKANRARYGIKN
jgi:hypothetical protein